MPSPFTDLEAIIAGLSARVEVLEAAPAPEPEVEFLVTDPETYTMESRTIRLHAPAGRVIVGAGAVDLNGDVAELHTQLTSVSQDGDVQFLDVVVQATPVFPPASNSGTARLFLAHVEA